MTNIWIWDIETYKRMINNISEWVWVCNKNEETIYINNSFHKITWYTNNEIKGKKANIFWDKDSLKIIKNNTIIKEQINLLNKKWQLIPKDWTIIPTLCNWTSLPWWWTIWLITDLREIIFLKEIEEKLRKINKTKDEFISIVWHELRTPLSSIKWYLSMILDWDMWEINLDTRKALNHSYNSSNRLINLVNDVLSLSKIESWKMEYYMKNINVIDFLKSVYKDIYMEIENKSIELKMDFDNKINWVEIKADEDKLKQIFLNLITNAIKFTHSWWKITIKTRKIWKKIKFEIIDTWEWIEKEKTNYIFEKFNQVESTMQRQNTTWLGLWLSLCKNFIKEFWSEIKVKSELWKWSNFYFEIKIV